MHLKSTEFNEILKDILKHPYKKESDIYILNTYLKSLKKFMNIIQSENTHYDIEDLLSKISSNLTPLQIEKNNMLMKICDKGDYFYIILSGAVGVLVKKTISINMTQEQYVNHLKILYNNEPYLFKGTLKLYSKNLYFNFYFFFIFLLKMLKVFFLIFIFVIIIMFKVLFTFFY